MKRVLLATAFVFMSGNAWAETSEYTCPSGSASTLHCFTCGSNCTMTLDTSTGHAVVEGTGEMETLGGINDKNTNAWGDYQYLFKSVEIKNGITSIGAGAFQGTTITSAIIPDTVTKIDAGAFARTYELTSAVIPDSVNKIAEFAFHLTGKLQDLVIPDSVLLNPDATRAFQGALLTNVICSGSGNSTQCNNIIKQGGGKNIQSVSRPNYKLDENGKIVERYQYDEQGQLITTYEYNEQGELIATYGYDNNGKQYLLTADGKLSLKNADGSTSIYNKDGELVGIKGKKIYTVEEAEAVTAHGDRFHVSLTYK